MRNSWRRESGEIKWKKNSTVPNRHMSMCHTKQGSCWADLRLGVDGRAEWGLPSTKPPGHWLRKQVEAQRNKLSTSYLCPPTSGTASNNCCSCPQVEAMSAGSLQEKVSHARYPRDMVNPSMEKRISVTKKKKSLEISEIKNQLAEGKIQ